MTGVGMLEKLLAEGIIWVEELNYVGRASDGVIVGLGAVGHEKALELYLATHPTPDTW